MADLTSDTHELVTINDTSSQWEESGRVVQSLPRVDGGRQAWLFLAFCFLIEALIWGFPFGYGVFQVYYNQQPQFAHNKTGIAAIGTTQTGVMYFSCPLVAILMQRWPRARRPSMCVGAVIMVLALVAASFCNSVEGLLATQSVMYAVGGLLLYFPSMSFVDEWFVVRKGLAYGIMWAGTGSAGLVVPFLLQWLLDSYGFRTALRVWAVILTLGLIPCLIFVKNRLPTPATGTFRPRDLRFMKTAPFWLFEFGVVMQSLAMFLPALWIPSFSLAIGLPKFTGPAGLALLNLAACFGAIFLGGLVDRFHISTAIAISTVGQMVALFVFWGLTLSQPMLFVFALVWGLFGGGFSATWSGYAATLKRHSPETNVDTGMVVALMAGIITPTIALLFSQHDTDYSPAGRGIGAVVSGPLSESLLESGWKLHADFAYGTAYGSLIIFSGVAATFGGAACIGRAFRVL